MKLSNIGWMAALLLFATACGKAPEKSVTPPVASTADSQAHTPKPTDNAAGEAVKASVEQLIDLAQKGDCKAMAPLIVLSHSGGADDWKRSLNYETPSERVMTDKECARLQVLCSDLKGHTYVDFSQEEESEGQWNIWTVNLEYQDGNKEEHAFAFLPQGNGYLLGDID